MPDNDALERLSKRLGRAGDAENVRRSPLPGSSIKAEHAWAVEPRKIVKHFFHISPIEILFAGSLTFFVIALALSSLLFFSGNNTVSTKNVDVHVTGPTEIGAGSTLALQVVITNRNAVPMELTDLVLEFPPGTRSPADVSVELPRIRESLGTIASGESVNRTIRAVAFGAAGKEFIVKASAEYRVPSSNAVFVSQSEYVAKISQSPASIVVEGLNEVISGQDITITVDVVSNSPELLSNMILLAEYPAGFSFQSSSPSPVSGISAWNLGDIEVGGTRTVIIHGRFSGEDGDMRVIHFSTGNKKQDQDDEITAPLATSDITMTISKPFISVELALNHSTGSEFSIKRGVPVVGEIRWTNNLPVRVQDVEITLAMKGSILDKNSVTATDGFYRSQDTSITWSRETSVQLADVQAGESGVVNFTFAALPPNTGSYRNPELQFEVTIKGRRISESNVPEVVTSSAKTRIVVATDLDLLATLSRSGTFFNSGPIPPQVEKQTTYTATWIVSNNANALANVSVTATLPSYVAWMNMASPGTEAISYNPTGSILTWQIGDLPAGSSRSVSFQVGVTPSISQINTTPSVVNDQRAYGIDRFIRAPVEKTIGPLTTQSAATSAGQGSVVP